MNKTELINTLAERTHFQKKDAAAAVNGVLEIITDTLANGDHVAIAGFGKFEVRVRPARRGKNPKTGEMMEIPETVVPTFKAGTLFKDAVTDH